MKYSDPQSCGLAFIQKHALMVQVCKDLVLHIMWWCLKACPELGWDVALQEKAYTRRTWQPKFSPLSTFVMEPMSGRDKKQIQDCLWDCWPLSLELPHSSRQKKRDPMSITPKAALWLLRVCYGMCVHTHANVHTYTNSDKLFLNGWNRHIIEIYYFRTVYIFPIFGL